MSSHNPTINGHLDIIVSSNEDEFEGKKESRNEVLIHGNPEGLRSLANLLFQLADADQESNADLPVGAREHEHLYPGSELSKTSVTVIVGRLDAKGTGTFYERYSAR